MPRAAGPPARNPRTAHPVTAGAGLKQTASPDKMAFAGHGSGRRNIAQGTQRWIGGPSHDHGIV
jgi:hypothetical protein